ncbi:MAG: NAD-dependent epimerase/dehydratase family protein [Firmicutes bacterium]|nr:NAD-dependent epimerase/dehydratase family protein [Bacillota bacterium]
MQQKKLSVVTGATGRIGVALCAHLREKGERIRAIYFADKEIAALLEGVADEVVHADIRDYASVLSAFEGAEYVYHLAGVVSIETKITPAIEEVNITGTKNVVRACKELGVRRLIYTGTVHTLPFTDNKHVLTEIPRYLPDKVHGAYAVSKSVASNIVLDAVQNDGLNAVLGLPSGVIGGYEYKRSNFGQMIVDVSERKLKIGVRGRYDFVDTRDVAAALYDLSENGIQGESYILSGHTASVKEMLRYAADAAGTKPPRIRLPLWFVRIFAGIAERSALKRGKLPMFTPYSMKVLRDNCNFSHAKITALTGYAPRPVQEAIAEQVRFYKEDYKKFIEGAKK